MSDRPWLFITDPPRFMELMTTEDRTARMKGFSHLDDIALCEIIRFGIHARTEMFLELTELYRTLFVTLPDERRLELYNHVFGFVEHASVSFNAFMPFIICDPLRRIVATAVIDYVSIGPLTDGDPMSRVRDITEMIEDGVTQNEGAAFGALLNLGDQRVCRLLIPLRDTLSEAAVNQAIKCSTGFISAATVEFYMDWLEGLDGDEQDGLFGEVASGLIFLKRESRTDQVFTGHRLFPMHNVTREQATTAARPISLADYTKCIAPRLYALERAEPPPRVMPKVLAEWDLDPVTDPSETAPPFR